VLRIAIQVPSLVILLANQNMFRDGTSLELDINGVDGCNCSRRCTNDGVVHVGSPVPCEVK